MRYIPTTPRSIVEIRAELDKVAQAIDTVLHRDGDEPNMMLADLDMNGSRILNSPAPVHPNDLVRLQDLVEGNVNAGVIPSLQPRQTGDGTTVVFDTPSSSLAFAESFFVTVDGEYKRPYTAFTIGNDGRLTFTTPPVDGSDVDITWFAPNVVDFNYERPYVFDTVADMKTNAVGVPAGSLVRTKGYFAEGDGGGNTGIIREGTHTEDGGSIISITTNLYAEMDISDGVTLAQFGGFDGDSITTSLQNALNVSPKVTLGKNESYTSGPIQISNSVELDMNGSTLSKEPSSASIDWLLSVAEDASDITIRNGILVGDSLTHLNGVGEGVHNIYLFPGADNIKIIDIESNEAFGDGLYTGDFIANKPVTNVDIIRYRSKRCRRQGISITSGINVNIIDCVIEDVSDDFSPWPLPNGPWAGIDIEPNSPASDVSNIVIRNLTTLRCKGAGVAWFLPVWARGLNRTVYLNFSLINHKDIGSREGADITLGSIGGSTSSGGGPDARILGKAEIVRPQYENNRQSGLKVRHWTNEAGVLTGNCQLDIIEPVISNWARDQLSDPKDSSALVLLNADISGNDYGSFAGVNIVRPRAVNVSNLPTSAQFIYGTNEVAGRGLRNCLISEPFDSNLAIRLLQTSDIKLVSSGNFSSALGQNSVLGYEGWLTSNALQNDSSVTQILVGRAFAGHECIVQNAGTTLTLAQDTGVSLRDNNGAGISTITMNSSGAQVKLRWITATVVLAEKLYGNVT